MRNKQQIPFSNIHTAIYTILSIFTFELKIEHGLVEYKLNLKICSLEFSSTPLTELDFFEISP